MASEMKRCIFPHVRKLVNEESVHQTQMAKTDFTHFYQRQLPSLCFHDTHGENVAFLNQNKRYCKAIQKPK